MLVPLLICIKQHHNLPLLPRFYPNIRQVNDSDMGVHIMRYCASVIANSYGKQGVYEKSKQPNRELKTTSPHRR
jgi:hypothetical protein